MNKERKLYRIAQGLLILLIALILLNIGLIDAEILKDNPEPEQVNEVDSYISSLETRLKNLIEQIDGAGNVEVMITAECDYETVYAKQRSWGEEISSDGSLYNYEYVQMSYDKFGESTEYIIIANKDGSTTGLVEKVILPKVRGVAIVCNGGNLEEVRSKIIDVVSKGLNVDISNISVVKGANKEEVK